MDEIDDLFGEVAQPERAPEPRRKPLTSADVREQMVAIIDTLRAADAQPFDDVEWRKHVAMFPIMAQWLEPEDGEQLVFQFEEQVERLKVAA